MENEQKKCYLVSLLDNIEFSGLVSFISITQRINGSRFLKYCKHGLVMHLICLQKFLNEICIIYMLLRNLTSSNFNLCSIFFFSNTQEIYASLYCSVLLLYKPLTL